MIDENVLAIIINLILYYINPINHYYDIRGEGCTNEADPLNFIINI